MRVVLSLIQWSEDRSRRVSRMPAAGSRWSLILVLMIGAVVQVGRGVAIAEAHTERLDDPAMLHHGLSFLDGTFNRLEWVRNPPVGAALGAFPLWLAGVRPRGVDLVFYDQPISPEEALRRVAIWKSLLSLPLIGLAFHWARSLYGQGAGWLASIAILVEPNFAAHTPLPTTDVLCVQGFAFAAWLSWRYCAAPSTARLAGFAAGFAFALMMKLTAILLLPVVAVTAALNWRGTSLRFVLRHVILGALFTFFVLWALTGFDVAPMLNQSGLGRPIPAWLAPFANWPVPARMFWAAVWDGRYAMSWPAFLLGMHSQTGWWYYFPILALYKIPLGIMGLLALGVASFRRRPVTAPEQGLLVPLAALIVFLLLVPVNVGFRHALPAYFFAILLATRAVASAPRIGAFAWLFVAAAGTHALTFHPDYLSYVNFSREKVARDIGDSNLDWGQATKQIARWLDDRRLPPGKHVWLIYHPERKDTLRHYIGDRATSLDLTDPRPTSGILIISPMQETGDPVVEKRLRALVPDAVIGHAALVYDLDAHASGGAFQWNDTDPRAGPR